MHIYRISKCKYINDLSGTGAATFGGRWNSKGVHILYTAASPSLALLESVVHISNIPVDDYCMTTLDIPENKIKEITHKQLPENWFVYPPADQLKKIGDQFIKDNIFLALKLPSAIMMEDFNYLVNPNHADFKKLKKVNMRTIPVDERFFRK
ncbi:MAG: RES family NAD+ phosphorylase [Chitinophagaceae bacterium]